MGPHVYGRPPGGISGHSYRVKISTKLYTSVFDGSPHGLGRRRDNWKRDYERICYRQFSIRQQNHTAFGSRSFHAIAVDLQGVPLNSRVVEDMQIVNDIDEYALTYGNAVMPKYEARSPEAAGRTIQQITLE